MAAGAGSRFGGPKQFLQLGGRPVAAWSVSAARTVADGVVLVVPPDTPGGADHLAGGVLPVGNDGGGPGSDPALGDPTMGADRVVAGGATRAGSVRAGLEAVPDGAAIIVVHDAARPLATGALFTSVVGALQADGVDGAIPVLSVADTLKRVTGTTVLSTVDRGGLVAVQTPQAFVAPVLRSAHRPGGDATDDAALVERLGATVCTVAGDPHNVKLTRPEDLVLAEALIKLVGP